jgi:hypothetical protein
MYWKANACYHITFSEETSMTFEIVGEIPPAMHQIRIRDLSTGKEMKLLDILSTRWIDFKPIECPEKIAEAKLKNQNRLAL